MDGWDLISKFIFSVHCTKIKLEFFKVHWTALTLPQTLGSCVGLCPLVKDVASRVRTRHSKCFVLRSVKYAEHSRYNLHHIFLYRFPWRVHKSYKLPVMDKGQYIVVGNLDTVFGLKSCLGPAGLISRDGRGSPFFCGAGRGRKKNLRGGAGQKKA